MRNSIQQYLEATRMLDFHHPRIRALTGERGWRHLTPYEAIGAVYEFVRDEIRFGYNADDRLPASAVLRDGYGQCNTKGTLLMALLRALDLPCRFHGFTIHNALQLGAIPRYLFALAPARIIHSWVEVQHEGRWINLEGYILDRRYLGQVQAAFRDECARFTGFGIATTCLVDPPVEWRGDDTYIQSEGIADDFGVFANPDDFYRLHGSNLSGIRKILFRHLLRHLMNVNVALIRRRGIRNARLTNPLA